MRDTEKSSFLTPSKLLDFTESKIVDLIEDNGWLALDEYDRIGAAYDFVRNEISFGYNEKDDIAASAVLQDGYGQCNTKATLLMALFRALGIPCRLHGFTIHKSLQRGIVPELIYPIAPESILHSWVEIWHEDQWINLEGFILDDAVLSALQNRFAGETNVLCGYGAGTKALSAPAIDWNGTDTYIQSTGINADLGLFDTPDSFYAQHQQSFKGLRKLFYQQVVRHWMNLRVGRMRKGIVPNIPTEDDGSAGLVKRESR